MMSRRTLHDTADVRVPAPAYPLQERQWTTRDLYINVTDMRHEMWRRNRFTLFSPF